MPEVASPARATTPAPTPAAATPSSAARGQRTLATPQPSAGAPPAVRLGMDVVPARVPDQVAQIVAAPGPGVPLAAPVQESLERTLGVPLGSVRVHGDTLSASVVASLGARAFTFGSHIFLGPNERPNDLGLMAHEAAHVVQQHAVPVVHLASAGPSNAFEREAERASSAAVVGGSITVHETTSGPVVQGLGLSDILDGLAALAANVPGFTLLTVIIGRNPITMRPVERNFTNILRGFMGLIPGGEILFQVLNRYAIVQRIGTWVEQQVNALGLTYDYLRGRFTAFTDSLSWRDIFSPADVWRRAQSIFTEPINRVRGFISRLISQAITWLKETFLQPLSSFCREIPGYTLVTVLLGRDPFTGAAVARTPLNLVRAFAEFIPGGTEKVNQLVESRALQRAYEWFIQETQARNLTWARVVGTFEQAWNALRLEDVLSPIETLRRVVNIFRPLMSDLVGFAGAALMKLLELIFEAVMGAGGARVLAILKRARETFLLIIQNPVGFLRNLLGAVGQGVRQFMHNILRHLQEGVIAWLTGPVARAGIQMPERWDVRGVIWFVLQILGLTWQRVREKLVRLLGAQVVAGLEAGFQLLQEIRQRGLVQALRDRVTEFFGQLREAALGSIRSFIQQRLVMAGIQQLLSLLSPVGVVIQAIIKTYTTVQFFIQRINQILDLVESIVNSIAAIASGAIGPAANLVERTMARTIPIILDFLARFIGVGDVGGHVQRTIQGLQARVDAMLDRAVDWIKTMAQRMAGTVVTGVQGIVSRVVMWWRERQNFTDDRGMAHSVSFRGNEANAQVIVETTPRPLIVFLAAIQPKVRLEANARFLPFYNTAVYLIDQINRLMEVLRASPRGDPQKEQKYNAVKEKIALLIARPLKSLLGLDATGASAVAESQGELDAEAAHQFTISQMRGSNRELLRGHGAFAPGYTGQTFTLATRNAVDAIGYATGDHSDPTVKVPGTSPAAAMDNSDSKRLGRGHWVPDHQPPNELAAGGALNLVFRFYPHSVGSARRQGGAVRTYKDWMKRRRGRGDNNWSEGIQSRWFW